jgi:hypothetical protein
LRWPRNTHYPQKFALTSPTSGSRSVCIVCSRTKTTEFFMWSVRVSWELLWLRHEDSSGIQRKGKKLCHWKSLPEDLVHAIVNCRLCRSMNCYDTCSS